MNRIILTLLTVFLFQLPNVVFAETEGERVAREAMVRAQAEKAKNDAIVEKQRAAEKARQDTENLEKACKKARTC